MEKFKSAWQAPFLKGLNLGAAHDWGDLDSSSQLLLHLAEQWAMAMITACTHGLAKVVPNATSGQWPVYDEPVS